VKDPCDSWPGRQTIPTAQYHPRVFFCSSINQSTPISQSNMARKFPIIKIRSSYRAKISAQIEDREANLLAITCAKKKKIDLAAIYKTEATWMIDHLDLAK
jgi:hypothetical protein